MNGADTIRRHQTNTLCRYPIRIGRTRTQLPGERKLIKMRPPRNQAARIVVHYDKSRGSHPCFATSPGERNDA